MTSVLSKVLSLQLLEAGGDCDPELSAALRSRLQATPDLHKEPQLSWEHQDSAAPCK